MQYFHSVYIHTKRRLHAANDKRREAGVNSRANFVHVRMLIKTEEAVSDQVLQRLEVWESSP